MCGNEAWSEAWKTLCGYGACSKISMKRARRLEIGGPDGASVRHGDKHKQGGEAGLEVPDGDACHHDYE